MTDVTATKASQVKFARIETGVLGNCRSTLTGIAELAANIEEHGLLEPLVVWHKRMKKEAFALPDGQLVWDRYILTCGNRRYAALVKIREQDPTAFDSVPVTLFTGNEDDALFVQVSENLQREDLTPLDLAEAVLRLRKRGHTQGVIAKRLGRSQTWVSRLLKLRQGASEAVFRALGAQEIPTDIALKLADLDEPAQVRALERFRDIAGKQGPRAAANDVNQSTGRATRPSVADIRARANFLVGGAPPPRDSAAGVAQAILAWVLGTGEWPETIPLPAPTPSSPSRSRP